MSQATRLTPANPEDVADALSFALRHNGRKRVHDAEEIMAHIVARLIVVDLEQAGFAIAQKPPAVGGAAIGRGFEKR